MYLGMYVASSRKMRRMQMFSFIKNQVDVLTSKNQVLHKLNYCKSFAIIMNANNTM